VTVSMHFPNFMSEVLNAAHNYGYEVTRIGFTPKSMKQINMEVAAMAGNEGLAGTIESFLCLGVRVESETNLSFIPKATVLRGVNVHCDKCGLSRDVLRFVCGKDTAVRCPRCGFYLVEYRTG